MGEERETRLQQIYDQALHLTGVLDIDGTLLEVNEAAQRFIGASQEALLGRLFWETPWWAHSAQVREQLKQAVLQAAAGQAVRFETSHLDASGEQRLIEFSIKPVRSRSGQVICLLPEGRDVTDCRRVQELAELERANLLELFEAAPFGIVVFTSRRRAVRTNAGLQRLFAPAPPEERLLQHGELNGCRRARRCSPEEACPWCQLSGALGVALEQGRGSREILARLEKQLDSPGPEWIQCSVTPVILDDEPHALLTVFDITEQKRAEERLRLFFEQTILAVSMVDEQGRVEEWNRAAERLSGLSREQVLGQPYWEVMGQLIPADKRSESRLRALEGALREGLRTGALASPSPHLVRLSRPDGAQIIIEEANFPIRTSRGFRFGSISHDVTARSQAEAAQAISEERYRIATLLTGQLIYDYDIGSGEIQWAGAVEAITGFAPEEFTGHGIKSWEALIHPEDREVTLAALEQAIRERTPFHCEYRLRRRDDVYITLEDTGGLVLAQDGQPLRLLGAMKDISERREAERQRQLLENQLQQAMKMEAVGRLAGGVAHDFNNLLTCISGNTAFVLAELPDDHPHVELLQDVEVAADSAAELTRQLLAFSRRQLIEPRLLDLNQLINKLERLIGRLIGEDIVFSTQLDPQLWLAKADPGQLEQILVNLAVNARDAMPQGGSLLINTANLQLAAEEVPGQERAGDYVALSVSDSGQGIPPEVQEHLFEPFFTTKGLGRGTGLGLATSYGAVKQAGGFITVDTAPARGTTIRICLPRAAGQLEPRAAGAADERRGGDETILVAEDDDLVRGLTVRVLVHYGYRVLEASCAAEALQVAKAHGQEIDLLLTDVVMPDSHGRELAEQLSRRFPQLAILFFSGYTADVIAHQGLLKEGHAFLAKPFSPAALAQKVGEILDRGGRPAKSRV